MNRRLGLLAALAMVALISAGCSDAIAGTGMNDGSDTGNTAANRPVVTTPAPRSMPSMTRVGWLMSRSSTRAIRVNIPLMYLRDGDRVYLHAASKSRVLRVLGSGSRLAWPSPFSTTRSRQISVEHSASYRSVMLFGTF